MYRLGSRYYDGNSMMTNLIYIIIYIKPILYGGLWVKRQIMIFLLLRPILGPWSSCSATCGGGHQFRAAQCMDRRTSSPTEGCDALEKPRQRQRCANDPCSRSHHSQHSIQQEVKGTVGSPTLVGKYILPLIASFGL